MATGTTCKPCAVALLGLVLVAGAVDRADAGTLTVTGSMDGAVDGSPFSGAAFVAVATFLWSADVIPAGVPIASYPASLTITIAGEGTYASAPGDEIYAILYQPPVYGNYGAEIQYSPSPSTLDNIAEFFGTETYQSATQTLLLADLLNTSSSGAFILPLAGKGSLEIDDFDSLGPTSTASIFVPEPSSLPVFGLGLAATLLLCRRRIV